MPVLKFLLALILGSTFAALIVASTSPENATFWVVIGLAATFALFGLLPAACLGMPALLIFQRQNVAPLLAALLLAAGGAAVGAMLMAFTFTGFKSWGAIAGGSIGLMQGLLHYRHQIAPTDSAVP